MKMTDRIEPGSRVTDDALQGGGKAALPRRSGKDDAAALLKEEVLLEDAADFLTISDESRGMASALSGETAAAARPDKPADIERKAFSHASVSERAVEEDIAGIGVSAVSDDPHPTDEGGISGGARSFLKYLVAAGAGEPREIFIPQSPGMSPFLMAILNDIFPDGGIRLLRVYRRKVRPPRPKEGREEEGDSAKEGADAQRRGALLKGYHAGLVTISAAGFIKTADGLEMPFSLGLDVTAAGERGPRDEEIRLEPLAVNYGGPASSLDDASFVFVAAPEDRVPFSGGAGRLVIELVDKGRADDGSVIYGVPDRGQWMEET